MNEKDILRRHAMHAYALTDADRIVSAPCGNTTPTH